MIELQNRQQSGNFAYTGTNISAVGNYNADIDGKVKSLYATFTQDEQAIGNADVYFIDGQTPQYNIHGNNVMTMIAIANAVETVYQELQDELEGE